MIEHLKSGLSISTHIGCGLKCSYCILSKINKFNDGPILEINPKDLVNELINNNEYYCSNKTPLMINNRTDPFLPQVTPYTLEILDLLVENNISSPIIIISKFAPPCELKKYFSLLNICYFYSYSGIETDFNYKKVYNDVKVIKEIVPKKSRFHYFRPIIPGVNDNMDYVKKIIDIFYENDFKSTVIAGLRVTSTNKHLINDDRIDLDKIDYNHKLIDTSIYDVNTYYLNTKYRVYRHTSCIIANYSKKFNKLNYFNRNGHCINTCPNYKYCNNKKINLISIIKNLNIKYKNKYVFEINNDKIEILSECDQELTAFIKNAYGCGVIANNIKLSKSEEVILNE